MIACEARLKWLEQARSTQVAPTGDWSVWALITGRGFGKTRSAAEEAWWQMIEDPGLRAAVIAPTNDDVRHTCFEGESGLLACCPEKLIKAYNRSMLTLELVNGSIIRGFSSEKPERLRGPQHGLCLAGNTIVTMGDYSTKLLKDVLVGDFVLTRVGSRRVTYSGMTNSNTEVFQITSCKTTILGTKDHLVYTINRGWVPLGSVIKGDTLCHLSNTQTKNGGNVKTGIIAKIMGKGCIVKFTKTILAQSQRVKLFTIEMVIKIIMTLQITNLFRGANILNYMPQDDKKQKMKEDYCQSQTKLYGKNWSPELVSVGCVVKSIKENVREKLVHFVVNIVKICTGVMPSGKKGIANIAAKCLLQTTNGIGCAVTYADDNIIKKIGVDNKNENIIVISAANCVNQNKNEQDFVVTSVVDCITDIVQSVEKYPICIPVYDISVEEEHEFFANGVVVHNCWLEEFAAWSNIEDTWAMMKFGLRLGKNPRKIITTTPKPIQLVRDVIADPGTVVVRGSTYDNKANLPEKFFEDVVQYEGTALGRQELHGELINLEEMGIFKRSWFKVWPKTKPYPICELIVQSWDTAFSEKQTADFTVCTTWGLFPSTEGTTGYGAILWDAWADQIAYPDLRKKAIKEYGTKYGPNERRPDIVLIEEKASGQSLIQDLRRAGIPVRAWNPGRQDKTQRAHTISHLVKDGLIYIPESQQSARSGQFMTWANEMIEQLVFFPNVRNDDYVDSFVQFISLMRDTGWMTSQRAESGELTYWRRLMKKGQGAYG